MSILEKDDLTADLFGTAPHLLTRTADPATSHAAAAGVDTTGLEKMVYQAIKARGSAGIHAGLLLHIYSGFPYSSITARFSALERKGLIYYFGDVATGPSGRKQRIMRANRRATPRG